MTTEFPKVSIITPSYNQSAYIERTIRSVIDQSYKNIEYIIIDGGSTDGTVDIIKNYEDRFSCWVSEPDQGQAHALNKGLKKCTGEIIAYINSDDYYNPGAIESVVNFFRSNGDACAVCGYCTVIWETNPEEIKLDTDTVGDITFKRLLRYWNPKFCPPQSSLFFLRQVVDAVGYFDERLHYTMDLDYWIRISRRNKIHLLKKNLSNYLIHPDSKSGSAGGFDKFLPERKQLSNKYKRELSFLDLIKHYKDYVLFPLKRRIRESYWLN
jgi:glycosyltransferase involved in cell wall biosynthesis